MAGMLEYKCPCCDGAIQFDSATQKMKCPYCDTEFDVDTLKGYDEELKDEKPSEDIDKAALERGIPGRTVRDAKRELGDALKSKIVEGRKKVFWME